MAKKINLKFQNHPALLVMKEHEKSREEKLKLAKILFEEKNSPCLYLVNEAVASIFVNGQYSGLLVDSGSY